MTFSSPPLTHKKHKTLNVSHPSAAQVFCNNSTGSPHMSLALECDLPKLELQLVVRGPAMAFQTLHLPPSGRLANKDIYWPICDTSSIVYLLE